MPSRCQVRRPIARQSWCAMAVTIAAAALSQTTSVAAQSRVVRSELAIPDLHNTHTVISLVALLLLFPALCVGTVLLWKRRKHFPIAGRGSKYLMWLVGWQTGSCILFSGLNLAFPDGLPCGIAFFVWFILNMPIAVIYVLRGWTLVFRLEIMCFLTESRWREEKKSMLLAHKTKRAEQAEAGEGSDNGTTIVTVNAVTGSGDEDAANKDEAEAPLPGQFFIVRRHWIEAPAIRKVLIALSVVVSIMIIIVGIFDPDPELTTELYHSTGVLLPAETSGNQFQPDTWASSPVCIPYSIKAFLFQLVVGIVVIPPVIWCAWRIHIDRKRRAERKKDQAEVHLLVHGTELEETATATSKGRVELDDTLNVKNELLVVMASVIVGVIFYAATDFLAPSYALFIMFIIIPPHFFCSTVMALRLSYAVSRKHREMLGGSRTGSGSSPATRLPHQRPYFTLKYILNNHYETLLKFLQKEYSSENALFYSEAREFERAAQQLTARIPSWPLSHDADETTGTAGVHSSLRSTKGPAAFPTRTLAGMGPPSRTKKPHLEVNTLAPPMVESFTMPPGHSPVEMLSTIATGSSNAFSPAPSPTNARLSMARLQSHTPILAPSHNASECLATSPLIAEESVVPLKPKAFLYMKTSADESISPSVGPIPVTNFSPLHAEARRLHEWADKMFRDYLTQAAIYEINIPEDLSKLVGSQVKQLTSWQPTPTNADGQPNESQAPLPPPFPLSTLYRQVYLCIFDLIQRDSFRRFVITPEFEALLARADDLELARLEQAGDLEADTKVALDKALAMAAAGRQGIAGVAILKLESAGEGSGAHQRVIGEISGSSRHLPDGHDVPLPGVVPASSLLSPASHDGGSRTSKPRIPHPQYSRVVEEENDAHRHSITKQSPLKTPLFQSLEVLQELLPLPPLSAAPHSPSLSAEPQRRLSS